MGSDDNNTIHLTTTPRSQRFVPACPICGNNHWPRDPSCLGKKGAKAKAKAKAAAKAEARAKRLGPANANTYQTPEAPKVVAQVKPVQATHPAKPNIPMQPAQPVKSAHSVQSVTLRQPSQSILPSWAMPPTQPANTQFFSLKENTDIQPEPEQQQGGPIVVNIKAKSQKEITSFTDEITRIKRQADQVVLRTSEDASHQVQAEHTARINAEEIASNEVAARINAEQKLTTEIIKLKALQEEARQAIKSNTRQMQQLQQEFTSDIQTSIIEDAPIPLSRPSASYLKTSAIRVAPSYTSSNVGMLLAIRARDIMEKSISWANPEETISSVLDRMLTENSYYTIVIAHGHIEGIVSRAELTGPNSSFLKPFIVKWQRANTDATFNIAIKWIMSKQVNSVSSDDTCTAIMKKMRFHNMCPLPVIDDGKAIGLVTPFNIFKIRALLKLEGDNTACSNRQLIQALPPKISSYLSELEAAKKSQSKFAK